MLHAHYAGQSGIQLGHSENGTARNRSGGEYPRCQRDADRQPECLSWDAGTYTLNFTGHQYLPGGDDHATRHRHHRRPGIILKRPEPMYRSRQYFDGSDAAEAMDQLNTVPA